MNNEYKPVVGFENFYLVNKIGDIVTLRNKNGKFGNKLKPYKDKDGYLRVKLYNENKSIWIGVHKVVAMAFLENPNNYDIVNHKNYIRDDNRADNLEWCNQRKNVEWSIQHYKGVNHKPIIRIDKFGNAKLYNSLSQASKECGVSVSNICNCCKNKRKTAGGYVWKYSEVEITEVQSE